MTRSTSAALDCPGCRPRPSKLAHPEAVTTAAAATTAAIAVQVLETDSNADSSAENSEAAARTRLVDDIHLAHHAVHGHLDVERDRNARIAEAAHVPGPDIALQFVEALRLIGRPEQVVHLFDAGGVRDDLGDVLVVQALLHREEAPIGGDPRHKGLAAVGLARIVVPGLATRPGALLGRRAHDFLHLFDVGLSRRQAVTVEGGAGGHRQREGKGGKRFHGLYSDLFALAGFRRKELRQFVRNALPGVGVGRRRALAGDVGPLAGKVGVQLEPLLRLAVGVGQDRRRRAFGLAHAAVDALVGVDHQHVFAFVEAVDRTHFHAVHVLALDAVFGNDVGHERIIGLPATTPVNTSRQRVAATARGGFWTAGKHVAKPLQRSRVSATAQPELRGIFPLRRQTRTLKILLEVPHPSMIRRLLPLAPVVVILGALVLIASSGAEIALGMRGVIAGMPWPPGVLLDALVAGSALLLCIAVLITRRSMLRTASVERALRESEERLRLVANSVPALISYLDRESRFRFSNRTYDDWFGIPQEHMHGRTVAEVFGEEIHARMKPHIERVLSGEEVEFEFTTERNAAEGGRQRTLQVACVPHLAPEGAVLGFYMLGNDVTALKRAQEDLRFAAIQLQHDARRLEFLAHHDTLTGLPNRAMFQERAREAVAHARRHDKTAAVLFIDLDNFKQVNDTLGHDVGDALLKIISSRLRASVRGDDFIARIGGDEFCVLLQDIADPREAASVAQKLVHELNKPYRIGEHQVSSGASIGIACVPQDGDDVATLLRLADLAMYRAKELGRNGYQFFSSMLNEDAVAAAALVDELRHGMQRDELFLVYQPRIDVATRQVVGAEALLRWRHPRYGVLAPESFLPLADDTGLLVPIGGWALREACLQGRRWMDEGIGSLTVVVNLTARQLRDGPLVDQVDAALRESGLPAQSLLLELPETVMRQVPESMEATLRAITERGVRLGVDDFGTGYASLPTLQRLHASSVCIDRKLISGVPQDTERAGLARALIALARGMNFEVVAKGVESPAQREFLSESGCRICQGSLFAVANSAEAVAPMLRARLAA